LYSKRKLPLHMGFMITGIEKYCKKTDIKNHYTSQRAAAQTFISLWIYSFLPILK
jgi:hypothetical protein